MKTRSHSADVRLTLFVGNESLDVAQVGSRYLILRNPINCNETNAILEISIDGKVKRSNIVLPDGISVDKRQTCYL